MKKMLATLIADSVAAALIRVGRINAVIVRANRVACDIANNIGTCSLTVSASHHKIPFYVAAPVTSIDLSLSFGDQILIEERSAKELLYSEGGIGKQVVASRIDVWNPAIDVTPANLIIGIIIEKGVVLKADAAGDFDIKNCVQTAKGVHGNVN